MEKVILVNSKDEEIGTMEKLQAHKTGALHRAFSILIFNDKGEIMLQKRADDKYHSGGLWTNTCCSHPLPGESVQNAARRRLMEEMGIDLEPRFMYKFIYKAELDSGLIEHECDYVFVGEYNHEPILNGNEASDWRFSSVPSIKEDVVKNPDNYTVWFKMILDNLDKYIYQTAH